MKIKLYRSDWIGIFLGAAVGVYQPFAIMNEPMKNEIPLDSLIPVIIFGLITPPMLALLNKVMPKWNYKLYKKIGSYINFIFMIIAYGISNGVVGFGYHLFFSLPEHAITPIAFFCSAGFGFWGAYFVYPQIAFRPNKKA